MWRWARAVTVGGSGGVCWVTTTLDAGVGLRDLDDVEVDREVDLARVCSR